MGKTNRTHFCPCGLSLFAITAAIKGEVYVPWVLIISCLSPKTSLISLNSPYVKADHITDLACEVMGCEQRPSLVGGEKVKSRYYSLFCAADLLLSLQPPLKST